MTKNAWQSALPGCLKGGAPINQTGMVNCVKNGGTVNNPWNIPLTNWGMLIVIRDSTGNPVLPFHLEASSHWTTKSWDRTQIPKPFSTVALVMGEPLEVPADAADDQLESARIELEKRLENLETRALEKLAASATSGATV